MIPIKVSCACGQKYSFEVEPVNGRMPSAIACPVCGADGTGIANDIIARSMPSPPPPPLSVQAQPQPAQGGVVVMSGREGAAALMKHIAAASKQSGGESPERKWKWWYFILAGICIGGYSIWQADTQHSIKPLGSLFLAVLCMAIGIWDFFYQRRKKRNS